VTVPTTSTIISHTGNGSNQTFAFGFKVQLATDLVVYTTDGATVTTLYYPDDFDVVGLGQNAGGSVVTTAPVGNEVTITLKRWVPMVQDVDIRNQSKFYAEIHEDEFDRLTMMVQQLAAKVALAVGEVAPSGVVEWGSIQGSLPNQTDLDTALDLKANLASPVLTGDPTAPTQTAGADDDTIATMAALINERDVARTLTNVRIDRRVVKITSSATPTPDCDVTDLYCITALAAAATIANPTGTPTDGQQMMFRIKDNATARALSWGSAYVPGGIPLPTTTVLSKIMTLGFMYNTDNALNKWCLIAAAQEA
jgi:hypothetical protein